MYNAGIFALVKRNVSILDCLAYYLGEPIESDRDNVRTKCPVCDYEKKCLSTTPAKNAFKCFHCDVKGNVLDLVAAMEKVTPRKACDVLIERYELEPENASKNASGAPTVEKGAPEALHEELGGNKPLNFELKNIDLEHPDLDELGVSNTVLKMYNVGKYTGKGLFKDCIVAPIYRDKDLLGYCGFAHDDSGRWRVTYPEKFNQSADIYTLLPFVSFDEEDLWITTSPLDALRLRDYHDNVVSLMSPLPSAQQLSLIKNLITEGEGDIASLGLYAPREVIGPELRSFMWQLSESLDEIVFRFPARA